MRMKEGSEGGSGGGGGLKWRIMGKIFLRSDTTVVFPFFSFLFFSVV